MIASILPWVCICKDVKKMKQRWATRCQKCIKRQLLCPARCALRKTKKQKASRSSCVHCHLCQSIRPHRATWGCTRGRASGDLRPWGLCSFTVDACALPRGQSSGEHHQQLSAMDQEVAALSSARRCRTVRAWKLRAVMQSSCKSWASSKAAEAPSRAATALATRFKKAAEWGSQAAVVFSDQRGELNTVGAAHLSSLQVRHFCSCVCRGGSQSLSRRRTKSLLPQRGREGQVKRSRRAKVRWHKQVSWPSSSRALFFRSLGGRSRPAFSFSGCSPALSAQWQRMSWTAVWRRVRSPPAPARASMVRVAVKDSITLWAPSVFHSIWYAETVAELSSKRSRLHASASERDRSKEGACTWLGFGAKDGLGRNWGIAELLLPACFVRQLGEGTLGFGQGRIGRERDRHQSVEGRQCILNGSLVTGALVGVDGMQVSGLPRGASDRS